jgi:NAD(P)H-dependent FMN reductase
MSVISVIVGSTRTNRFSEKPAQWVAEELRENMIEVQVAPVRSSVHIPTATLWSHFQGKDLSPGLK